MDLQYCSNNLVWKFNKKAQYPMAIFRSNTRAILKIRTDTVYDLKHFRESPKDELIIINNILAHNVVIEDLLLPKNELDDIIIEFNLYNPIDESVTRKLSICPVEYVDEPDEGNFIRLLTLNKDESSKLLYDYIKTIGFEVSKKINTEIERRFNWVEKTIPKLARVFAYRNKDKYIFLDDIPLDDYIVTIMIKFFYDPIKISKELDANYLLNKLLIFHIE